MADVGTMTEAEAWRASAEWYERDIKRSACAVVDGADR